MNTNCDLYKILLSTEVTDEGIEYYAEFREFEYCSGCGDTADAAIQDARENLKIYLEELEEAGKTIPQPIADNEYSGRYALRLSKSLHKKAAECATREGVSLNSFISEAVCEKVENTYIYNILNKLETAVDKITTMVGFAEPMFYSALYVNQISTQTINKFGYRKVPQIN